MLLIIILCAAARSVLISFAMLLNMHKNYTIEYRLYKCSNIEIVHADFYSLTVISSIWIEVSERRDGVAKESILAENNINHTRFRAITTVPSAWLFPAY